MFSAECRKLEGGGAWYCMSDSECKGSSEMTTRSTELSHLNCRPFVEIINIF